MVKNTGKKIAREVVRAAQRRKLLLGVVHLRPIPGSPGYGGARIESLIEAALKDAGAILSAGFDGYIVENFGDVPFFKDAVPPHVLTMMTRIVLALPRDGHIV